ncbi:hypothetical protein MSMEI_1517 [Mycolicibacterium smegmatis MC2 155]|uniref:Uncharacterized protein n=1 Tax=Mycolicibacterium smegmatis (strain ATCC 700084 / mc(2)155) TaxID=246196 RepID=I7F8V2_MYCS2|nr:hypothetical protein MSMEI_1517 [Mycolicibacterium smegmatis MC2 155]
MPFLGTEALAAGRVNRYQLRTRYDAVFRNVYVPRGTTLTPVDKAVAAWLWSGRRSTVMGLSASALHGSRWIDAGHPAELNQPSRSHPSGITIHSDTLADDEVCQLRGIRATTPERTAFDLGRRRGLTPAVIRVDALIQATRLKIPDVWPLVDRHHGVRGHGAAEAGPRSRRRRCRVTAGDKTAPASHLGRDASVAHPDRGVRPRSSRGPYRHGLARVEGGCAVRRHPALDRSDTTHAGHRAERRVRGPRMAHGARRRRPAAVPPGHGRRPHPRRVACRGRSLLLTHWRKLACVRDFREMWHTSQRSTLRLSEFVWAERAEGGVAGGVLEVDARAPERDGAVDQGRCDAGGLGVSQAVGWVDVGDAVAVGVGAARLRQMGQIDAETVGDAEPGPLADDHQKRADAGLRADVIAQADAGLRGDDRRCQCVAVLQPFHQGLEQRRAMVVEPHGRQPVGEDESDVGARLGDLRALGGLAAQIRPAQIFVA